MIASLQTEGTCLFISQIDQQKLDEIYQARFIKSFILSENLLGQNIKWPYFQRLEKSQIPEIKSLQQTKSFLGYVLKLSDRDDSVDIGSIEYIDLEITSFRQTIHFCNQLDSQHQHKIFLSLSAKAKTREMNHLIHWIKKGEVSKSIQFFKKPYDLESEDWGDWAYLETFKAPLYQQSCENRNPKYSVIIPHYDSQYFVVNVLKHLAQVESSEQIEVLLIDDGSSQDCLQYIQYCAYRLFPSLNLQIFGWGEKPLLATKEKIFRAGASRNWGAQRAKTNHLLFLDSDMLVPHNLIQTLEKSLSRADIVQFKRLHIPVAESSETSDYLTLCESPDLYIEESDYWSQLFDSNDWMQIQDHWKMTCTYGLAIRKPLFDQVGRFRRHYIRYGFEDTDLGFRLSQKNYQFFLEKTPLLHLTQSNENTQSYFYKIKKMDRIKKMAKIFYLTNLDLRIYDLFRTFY